MRCGAVGGRHAFLREDYLNQVQRVFLTRAMTMRRTPSEFAFGEGRYFELKNGSRQAAILRYYAAKMMWRENGRDATEMPKKKPDRQM